MISYFNQVVEALFVFACKAVVLALAVAFVLDKTLDINIFKF